METRANTNLLVLSALLMAWLPIACSAGDSDSTGGSSNGGTGGHTSTGGNGSGGTTNTGGTATGGNANTGGSATGGTLGGTGGRTATGGAPGTGGSGSGGSGGPATGGNGGGGQNATGGVTGIGGQGGAGGRATGGSNGTGGSATGGSNGTGGAIGTGGTMTANCSGALPSGGTQHCSGNASGTVGDQHWLLWNNGSSPGCMTTYSTPAFTASWNNSGDYLARMGTEWGSSGKTYDQYGTITAQFAETKSGSAGGYSYIGVYGWSNNPCREWYIVDDSFGTMPVNPGKLTLMGTATIDGGTYKLYTRPLSGSGGRCSGSQMQYYSIRQTARTCGQISVTQHFDAWKAAGMPLGNMIEVKVAVEAGGGDGKDEFATASVTTTQ